MEHEAIIRLSIFLGIFGTLSLVEVLNPRRARVISRKKRWFTNWGIILVDTLALRLLALALPLLAVGAAADAHALGLGLFHIVNLPIVVEFILAILVLDFAIWLQHLLTHKIPFLWRLHRVHHADRDMDATTAIRFHPIEILLSMLLKIGLVYLLGPSALAVIVFEIMLNGLAMFNHANIHLPQRTDQIVRKIIVTPDMHRVHHSVERSEHNANYGFALSIWDQIFGTYIAQPNKGHDDITVGLQWDHGFCNHSSVSVES